MGALDDENPSNPGTLSFRLGNERTLVSILTLADIFQRNRIIDTLLHLSSLRFEGTQPYIAVPRLLGATLDSQIFRSSGIGLLLYDERRIEETIKTEPIQHAVEIQVTPIPIDNPLLADLTALKSMYAELERNMRYMMAEFKSFRENALSSTSISNSPSNPVRDFGSYQRPDTAFKSGLIEEGSLPSFFTNNPWLDVLSKRARMEDPPPAD